MSNVWFTSDWHLGHNTVETWRHELFPHLNVDNFQELIVENFLKLVGDNDITYFIGDMLLCRDATSHNEWITRMKALPGRKILVMGNHDTDHLASHINIYDLLDVFENVAGMIRYKQTWLTHAPIHPSELRGRVNVHGHTHHNIVSDYRYINVCPEVNDFKPLDLQSTIAPRVKLALEKE